MSNTDHTALRMFVNHPSWMEHGRQIVAINKVCPSRMFGGELFLFGSEIRRQRGRRTTCTVSL